MKRSKSRSIKKEGSRKKRSYLRRKKGDFKQTIDSFNSKDIPLCKPKLYCGGKPKAPSFENYDGVGNKDECFKKGMGVGMMIELKKIKTKLATKGIILVTKQKQKSKCIDKQGNIKLQ
jgi:hypothetical protein